MRIVDGVDLAGSLDVCREGLMQGQGTVQDLDAAFLVSRVYTQASKTHILGYFFRGH